MGVAAGTRVLFVTAELAPWAKVGGLGEVARDLPLALAREGADVRTLVPAYPALKEAFPQASTIAEVRSPGGAFPSARILQAKDGVPLYLLECDALYARAGGLYQTPAGEDWRDNHLRYGLLSRIAALAAAEPSPLGWQPQIVHGNDWQTGLAAAYLAYADRPCAPYLHTIHNIAYQGIFPAGVIADLAIPPAAFSVQGLEFHGQLSFLKAGIRYAAAITTVSPTYAREIQTPQFGAGLDGLIRSRQADLTGILNGIDPETWNPATDPYIARPYSADSLEDKSANKAALQRASGLPELPDVPLLGMVGRLVEQKGIDLVLEAAEGILSSPAQLVVLGAGPQQFVEPLERLALRRPAGFAVRTGFDEPLAHLVEAGADLFLMPSRFEPCGLNQLYSMRYGTPPIVRRTGGLADSVVDCTAQTLADGTATGFMFDAATAQALSQTVQRALIAYRDHATWRKLQANGMARDFRWDTSASRYLEVYSSVLARPRVAGARG